MSVLSQKGSFICFTFFRRYLFTKYIRTINYSSPDLDVFVASGLSLLMCYKLHAYTVSYMYSFRDMSLYILYICLREHPLNLKGVGAIYGVFLE